MASIETAIFTRIDDEVAGLGSRIYPSAAPQTAATPFAIYEKDSDEPYNSLGGYTGLNVSMFRITVWSDSYATTKTNSDLVRTALLDFDGTSDGFVVAHMRHDNSRDTTVWTSEGSELPLYGVEQDWRVTYKRT